MVKIRYFFVDMGNVGERYIVYYMYVVLLVMFVLFRFVNYEYLYFIKKIWVGIFFKKKLLKNFVLYFVFIKMFF